MYLSKLRLWNFRKYCDGDGNKPGVEVHFHEGLNVLIGENDSGKTAIIDAIRYVLRTQSGEYIQFDDKDFYQDEHGNIGTVAKRRKACNKLIANMIENSYLSKR